MLVLSAISDWQPVDFVESFKPAGEAILERVDPVLPPREGWHFLPTSAYVYAFAIWTGLPWEIGGRLYPMIADIVLIVLVGKLAGEKREALARFQYAVNPLALMVSTLHAQLEPVSLVFLAGAFVVVRNRRIPFTPRRAVYAGLLMGMALSSKSWPVILIPVLLMCVPDWKNRIRTFVVTGLVPFFFLITMPIGTNTPIERMPEVISIIRGVRPIVGEWGWTAITAGGQWELDATAARIGQVVLYSTLLLVMWLWRKADRLDMVTAMLLAFMVVTPRLGAQYLLWFMPFLIARPTRWMWPAITAVSLWAGAGYIYLTQFETDDAWWAAHIPWAYSSLAVIPFLVLAMPWARRVPGPERPPAAEAEAALIPR
ncbi:hypothetical protein D5H75_21790 [Bailinhaonella thermotolerans]|uniref:DUF2029 domain-containing protein n=2 Tax=Bailinhaonella thermotolerans TaxID=1070861 RepID=A0A3A4AYJ0_9ACTN|nr:hypothetical protein D5H75_21790 [Bailinhaonella thermotolerans]